MEQDFVLWVVIAGILERILAISVTFHAVLNKRDTRAVIGWVGAGLACASGRFVLLLLFRHQPYPAGIAAFAKGRVAGWHAAPMASIVERRT